MKIKKVIVKNYRGVSGKGVSFECDDYNLLIGDNGTSKTTILEAINLCLSPGYTASQLKIKDFHQGQDSPIEIYVRFADSFIVEIPDLFGNTQELECNGIALIAKKRDKSAPGKAFNDLVVAQHLYLPTAPKGPDGWTIKRKSGSDFKITERQLSLSYATAKHPRAFYFGKDRTRQLKKGYNSSISNIVDDLNWRFEKRQRTLSDEDKFKHIRGKLESYVFGNTDGDTLKKTIMATNKTLKSLDVEPIELGLIKTLNPYDNTEVIRRLDEFELATTSIGSGVEMIIAIVFLITIAKISKEDICVIIDEPEIHLHPTLQDKLARLLLSESSNSQVFLSSHSPFFFKNIYEHSSSRLLIAEFNLSKDVSLIDAKSKGYGLLKWSPSWGEICFFAYNLSTIEFHDDLYASIQDKNNTPSIAATEFWLTSNGQTKEVTWSDSSGVSHQETLMTYIRNRIHHGDNLDRPMYSYEQLEDSIKRMVKIL
jgi:AAA15 family ATPase/GTPase